MLDVLFSISAAFAIAVGIMFIRNSLSSSNLFACVIIITLIGNIVFWPTLLILNPTSTLNIYGLVLFALSGLLHPGLGRILYTTGMIKAGVPINASIFATYPLFGAIFAVLFLNEQPTLALWFGILCVMIGAIIIQGCMNNKTDAKSAKSVLLLPVFASVLAGLGYVMKKMGLNVYGEPVVGVAVASLTTLILYAFISSISPKIRTATKINLHTFKLFWKGGLCNSIGWLLQFYAVRYGDLSVVTPLMQTQTLFILLLTYLYLRKVEALSKKLVLGTLSIVVGVILITALRG